MSDAWLIWITLGGMFLTTVSAIAAKVLNDFARHEFEEYCEQRRRKDIFRLVVENYRQFTLGAEVVEMIGTSMTVLAGAMWLLGSANENHTISISNQVLLPGVMVGTGVLLLTSSWIPWAIVEYFANPFLFYSWRIWWIVSIMFQPVLIGMGFVGEFLGRLSGKKSDDEQTDEEEELEDKLLSVASSGKEGGFLRSEAREMIEGVIELDDLVVGKIMTPRSSVTTASTKDSWEQVLHTAVSSRYSRIPVFDESKDEIVGILYTRDILTEAIKPLGRRKSLDELTKEILRTPDTRLLNEMLKEFLAPDNKIHLAVVSSEFRGFVGVITMEDILEEIVGEITDETDSHSEKELKEIVSGVFDVSGRMRVDELNDQTPFDLDEDDQYDTVAGWLMFHCGEVPEQGQQVEVGGMVVVVQKGNERKIDRIQLEKKEDD